MSKFSPYFGNKIEQRLPRNYNRVMSSTNQIVHVLIPKSSLREDKVMDFDVFVKVSEKFVKVLNQGEKPDMKRIENYLSKKSDVLYIESGVIEKFMDKKFSSIFEEVTSGESMEDRIRSFVRCLELCYLDIKLVRPHPDKFMRLSMLTEASYEFFTDPYRQRFVLKAVVDSIESAISRRALFGASLSLSILCAQSTCPAKTFQSLFVGGILRDIASP